MDGINLFDSVGMSFFQTHLRTPAGDAVFPVITYLGEAGAVWLLLALFFLCRKSSRRCGLLMLCAVAGGFLFGEMFLKNIVCRARPFQMFPGYTNPLISPPSGFSFPSGHSCSSFAAATVLVGCFKKRAIPAVLLAALIAFSRIYLFVHWPTDVLAGILLGVLFGLLTLFLAKRYQAKHSESPDEAKE